MARNSASSSKTLLTAALTAALFSSACDNPLLYMTDIRDFVKKTLDNLSDGKKTAQKKPETQPTPEPTPTDEHRQANAFFVKELFKVVLRREVKNEEEFWQYMNIMDQGGHYEGIYNGIVLSADYRALEKGVAAVPAMKKFAEIMAQLTLDQRYDPLKIQKPEEPEVPRPTETVKPPQPTEAERTDLINQFEREYMTKSLYTLKRVLGQEVLKTIELKKEYREKLATWYGRFAVFLNKMRVDFGSPERNKASEYYHYKWALEADEDFLKWEALNRAHQVVNHYAK